MSSYMKNEMIKTPDKNNSWKMFDRIAHRYDLLNRLLSFGQDIRWRRMVGICLPEQENIEILDLATGTGDLLISLQQNYKKVKSGVGLDMAGKMLAIAEKKIIERKLTSTLSVVRGDACAIPFDACSFDAITIAFGIRNVIDVPLSLREMYRVLRNSGRALILEFSLPKNRMFRQIYLFYFRYILPFLGRIISGDNYAYRYLNQTVESFPYGQEFCVLMKDAGFSKVTAYPLSFGIATIYLGECIKE